MVALQDLRSLSDLLQRGALSRMLGKTFDGARNLYEALGYAGNISNSQYRDRYDRGDIAARIVEAYPSATWRGSGGELIEDEDPEIVTPFEQSWFDLTDKLNVWPIFKRADILAGLGEYAVILIGAPGALEAELSPVSIDTLFYLMPYRQEDAEIDSYVEDPLSERFGLPNAYKLSRLNAKGDKGASRKVHWTRIIHVSDGLLDDNVKGQPRLKRVWNRLDDLDKVVGGGAEAFWMRAHQGYVFNIDKDLKPDPKEKDVMSKQIDEFAHNMRRAVRTRGVNVETLGSDVADFSGPASSIISLISAATGIPQRILLGSERGQLASTQDRDNWIERIQDRRDEYAGPLVVRQFVDRLIQYGAMPEPEDYDVRWPEVNDVTDEQRIEVALKYAETNQKAGETVFTPNEIRDRVMNMEPLQPEDDDRDPENVRAELEAEVAQREAAVTEQEKASKQMQPRAASGMRIKHLERKQRAMGLTSARTRKRT